MVISTAFQAYGAGIPEPDTGQTLTIYEDKVEISNINRIVDPYRLFVGTTADHTITIGNGNAIHLIDFSKPQSIIVIDIHRVSIIKALL